MRKIIVVGAGIAGLIAAIYAQRSGFEVVLLEQHSVAGGMCTSWRRKGYLFEGAVHWLTGSNPKTAIHQIWEETGALGSDIPVLYPDPFRSVECGGQTIYLYRDIDKTVEHLQEVSPRDAQKLRQLAKEVKSLCSIQMPITDIRGLKSETPRRASLGMLLRMLPALPTIVKLGKLSCKDIRERFEHPGIRRVLSIVPDEYTATSLLFTLATLHTGDGGYPEGGSLTMVGRMVDTFKNLGGTLMLKTKAQRVLVEDGVATGVEIEGGRLDGDAVVVAQETMAALDMLFDVPPKDEWLSELKSTTKPAVCTFIGVGIKTAIPQVPEWQLDEPITYAGQTVEELGFNSYADYPGFAPEGGTALTTILMGDSYDFWKQARDSGNYQEEKQALADQISKAISKKFPHAQGNIEVIDIATPLTYERYTGAYHGSWMSIITPGQKMAQYSGEAKGVSGLYFTGHRLIAPGGLPVAALSGRQAAQQLCRHFDTVFR